MLEPPRPPARPVVRSHHGDDFVDDFAWMSDKHAPEFLEHLAAENAYTVARTAHLDALREELYGDILARTRQTDLTVPDFVRHGDGSTWWYYSRSVEGLDYPIHCRLAAGDPDLIPDVTEAPADEQVVLDENELARGQSFFALGMCDVSPDGTRLAWSEDLSGDERYRLRVIDLATRTDLPAPDVVVAGGGCWCGDDRLIYLTVDDAWRPDRIWLHTLDDDGADLLLWHETDERFWLGVDESRDRARVLLAAESKQSGEYRLLDVADPTALPRPLAARRDGLEYGVEVGTDALYIVHNGNAPEFRLSRAPFTASGTDDWEPLVPQRPGVRMLGVHAYAGHLVLTSRRDGLPLIEILTRDAEGGWGEPVPIGFDEPLYSAGAMSADDPATDRIRLVHESLVSPRRLDEYRLDTGERRTLKQTTVLDHPVHGSYDPSRYVQRREWATAPDGTRVPLSIVHRADVVPDGTAPALLYGYGAYEHSLNPWFSIPRLSLLDRGFVWAIAHVRGGGELGRGWYEQGRLLAKPNTFTDFVACARHLADTGWTSADRLVAQGGSAGGLTMGASVNLAPDAFRAVHADVPFVDALTTILNPDLPLTVTEWEEWGDPLHDAEVYRCMKGYTPYENVQPVRYPSVLATTSLNDTRVEVTEPAKWVAQLRRTVPADETRPILLRTELVAGHGGVSGRYQAWRDLAFELAWIIDQAAPETLG
ncbi:MAG: S9 family peptidase [Micropruina sp.]|uniref:S9 family peptidase n=1 Tax=Micropruina sp. TaxID=2737536 RepID=UPI0039E22F90